MPFKSLFESSYSQSQIQRSYLKAKIAACPYDYTLSDRMIFVDSISRYAIAYKTNEAEILLSDFLKLDADKWARKIFPRPYNVDMVKAGLGNARGIAPAFYNTGAFGSVIKFNNLMVHEDLLLNSMTYLNPAKVDVTHTKDTAKMVFDKEYLTAYTTLLLKCFAKDSITPYLFHANTLYKDKDLDYLINVTFVEDCINKDGVTPVFYGVIDIPRTSFSTPIEYETVYLDTAVVPVNPDIVKTMTTRYFLASDKPTDAETLEYLELKYKLGLVYTLAYGCEILYQYSKLNNKDKDLMCKLFTLGYDMLKVPFIRNLYTYNPDGELCINPDLEKLFDKDNATRFKNFITFVDEIIKNDTVLNGMKCTIGTNLDYFGIPLVFADLVANCHQHALQKFRVDVLSMLYYKAKEEGYGDNLDSEIESDALGLGDCMISKGMSESDDYSSSLMDLNTGPKIYGDSDSKDSDDVTKDTDIPMLDTLENLKTNLENSKYEFNIKHCTDMTSGYERSYNLIASNVKMLSHSLTKQIREIKTYNTGGKQPGASKGKLDRKNICHYKTSHNIFYSNDYKVKEMDLAFGIVLDMSGSMSGTGIKNGQIVMILLHEVLNSLRINHSIIGHDSDETHQSNIYKYYYFNEEKEHTLHRPYNLMGISAKYGNCDSGALFYMQQLMHGVRNKDKICIIFSDGAPTECTGSELREQVRSMEKEGIHVIGVGINFDSIKNYYSDYANGKNLQEMLDIVVNILTRYVLEKKD